MRSPVQLLCSIDYYRYIGKSQAYLVGHTSSLAYDILDGPHKISSQVAPMDCAGSSSSTGGRTCTTVARPLLPLLARPRNLVSLVIVCCILLVAGATHDVFRYG